MKIIVSKQSRSSLLQSKDYYNNESFGLGYEFVSEFISTLERIKTHPEAWTALSKNTRRCLMQRFPFSVIFRFIPQEQEIQIIALMHQKQKPKF